MVVGVLGTTISPYLFFWQAILEVEQTREDPELEPLRRAPCFRWVRCKRSSGPPC